MWNKGPAYSFACRQSVVQHWTLFSSLPNFLGILCQKSSGHLMCGYFWVFYSIPFTDSSVFMPVSHCFYYHHFVESWNQEMWIFQLCSLRWLWQFEVLWNAIGILGLTSISEKWPLGIWKGQHWTYRSLWE